jgi:RNA polymerase sigma-70 factor (ECF subfamily)
LTGKNASTIWKTETVPQSPSGVKELLLRGFRYAYSLTHDKTRAEDLLQDGWVSLLSAGGPQRCHYLFAAIRSRFIDGCRREQLLVFESLDEAGDTHVDKLKDPRAEAFVHADDDALDDALATLRPTEREALLLADVEGYTAQEIADLTGHPRGTVLSLIHRSRHKLRQRLTTPVPEVKRHA